MITLTELWIPILASAVTVFVASSAIHMVVKWHNSDYRKLPNEDEVRAAIRKASPAPGQYVVPHCIGPQEMRAPENLRKFTEGPVGMLTLRANSIPNMASSLGLWFLLTLVIATVAGYLASRALPAGASFIHVFRVVATVSFLAYAGGSVQSGIWMGKPWASVAKDLADSLIYASFSAAVFGWAWPH